jgi:hypothetical protein
MGCGQKSFKLGRLASDTSVANDKGDNEMILVAVHRSLGICLTVVETPENLS